MFRFNPTLPYGQCSDKFLNKDFSDNSFGNLPLAMGGVKKGSVSDIMMNSFNSICCHIWGRKQKNNF